MPRPYGVLSVSPSTHLDVGDGYAQLLGHDLGERGLVALALALHAELEDRLARRVHAQLGRVDHLQSGDVVGLGRTGPHGLGEMSDADPDEPAFFAGRQLLGSQLLVADLVERLAQGGRVVTRVVHESGGRLVGELLGLDEVPEAHLGRVDAQVVGRVLHQALDQERGLGDAERAAVGDAARCLVGEGALAHDVRGRVVVAARDHVEEAGLEGRRLGVGVERALVRQHVDPQGQDLAVVGDRQLALHVVVAGEAGGDEVLAAGLDPLDRLADEQRGGGGHHVARVDRHLVAEAATQVGADDADVLLG